MLADRLKSFQDSGFVLLRGALDPELCEDLGRTIVEEYQSLIECGWKFHEAGALAGHLNCRLGRQGLALYDAFLAAGLADLIQSFSAKPLLLGQAVGNLNLPASCYQDFHMDGDFSVWSIIANVCLVPTTILNGATELVAGSHRQPLSYWRFARDGWRNSAIAAEAQPGDVVIRISTLWHRGTPNRSNRPRPLAAFVYSPPHLVQNHPDGCCADLDGQLRIFGNRYQGRARKMKEFIAARLPYVDELLRQGRSFIGEQRLPNVSKPG